MSSPISIENGNCRVDVDPSGAIRFESRKTSLILDDLYAGSRELYSDPVVERSDDRIVIGFRRGGFRIEKTLSLGSDKYPSALHVSCAVTAERSAPFEGLTDTWRCSIRRPLDCSWAPNLRPGERLRIGSHCFRSPVVMLSGGGAWAALIPDFSSPSARASASLSSLNLDTRSKDGPLFGYGIEPTRPTNHVFFELDPDAEAVSGRAYSFDYNLLLGADDRVDTFLRTISAFLWNRFATPYLESELPQTVPFDSYADYAYPSIVSKPPFVTFDLDGVPAGGVAAEQAHAEYFRRPDPIVWNQAWFNAQRAAYGLGVSGKARGRAEWLDAGRRMTATTLGAPDWNGLWPAIYAYRDKEWWGSIPRLNGGRKRVHLADAALTGEWLLNWHQDVESTGRVTARLRVLTDRLCSLQASDGSIPPWFDFDGSDLTPNEVLIRSAETGAATVFLAEIARQPGFDDAVTGALRGAQFLATEIMPRQKYQDYETFFSCSPKDLDMVDPFTGILPQNSLAVFWTAKTMLGAFRLTGNDELLRLAREATDWLSLYQQVWNPPFLDLYTFGGFGVMNTDAEWNDARQSLFAPHYFAMYEATELDEYLARGIAALRASFTLASIPENAVVSPRTYDSFAPGLMPENYGHSGRDTPAGRSDTCWGESGALSSVAWLRNRYPDLITDLSSR